MRKKLARKKLARKKAAGKKTDAQYPYRQSNHHFLGGGVESDFFNAVVWHHSRGDRCNRSDVVGRQDSLGVSPQRYY